MAETLGIPEIGSFDPEAYMLLVAFGGQLEPKINREYMANGINVMRVEVKGGEEPDLTELDLSKCCGITFSGGNDSVYEEGARSLPAKLMELPVPKLGICYGQQRMAYELGGKVEAGESGEYGVIPIRVVGESLLFDGIKNTQNLKAMMNHWDVVQQVPDGCRVIAESPAGVAGFTNDRDIYAVQFHPESSDTEFGTAMLLNFATKVCGMEPEPGFTADHYRSRVMSQQSTEIQQRLGDPGTRTIVFDSGGVDSAVAHALTHEALVAIGKEDTISGVYIDCGLMRHEDGDTIKIMNEKGYPVETQDWSNFFLHEPVPLPPSEAKKRGYTHLTPMDQTEDPDVMRQIVKYGFIEVQRRIGTGLRARFSAARIIALVQGTNLADKIESGDFSGDQIKEHHNSGVRQFVDELLEPLSSLFKGDIRALARVLGLPPEIADRQPFPGPGLCLRIPANRTGETIWPEDIAARRKKLESICTSVGNGALSGCWLPVQATGQKGDTRVRNYITLLSGAYDPELLEKLAFEIPARTGATRVLYTPHEVGPDALRSTQQMVNEASLNPLRDAEEDRRQVIAASGLQQELRQHYVASLPVDLTGSERPTLMLRMFRTGVRTGLEDYITGEAALGGLNVHDGNFQRVLKEVEQIAQKRGYGRSVYDATHKPPGTVELA